MSTSTKVFLADSRLPYSGAGGEQYVAAQPVNRRICDRERDPSIQGVVEMIRPAILGLGRITCDVV